MTEPYYSANGVTIYHGDCVQVLDSIGGEFDLLLTDPPYGVDFKSNRGSHDRILGDSELDTSWIDPVCHHLKKFRHAYIFGDPPITGTVLTAKASLVWDKEIVGMGDLTMPWAQSHEMITFAVHVPSKANQKRGDGRLSARLRQGSVLRCPRTNSGATKRHPTEKPVWVLRQMIEASSILGEHVLDPFAGSGSTGEAAILEGRSCTLIEMDEKYCEVAAKRIEDL